jgi:hypothetical protein
VKVKYARACAAALVAGLIALTGLLGATPAQAQAQCSYPFDNCPTTTTSTHPQPVIVLDLKVAVPGETIHVTVCGYAPGTVVKITLRGTVVATIVIGDEPPASCTGKGGVAMSRGGGGGLVAVVGPIGRVLQGRLAAQTQPTSGGETNFQVPSDLAPGTYPVCADVAGEGSVCTNLDVVTNAQGPVLSSNNGNSTLSFTGMGLIRLVALALGLIAVGWMLMSERLRISAR